jgi:hypothetical protein
MSRLLALALLFSPAAFANHVDDSDLSGPAPLRPLGDVPTLLAPDEATAEPGAQGLILEVLREDHGALAPVPGLLFEISGRPADREATDGDGIARFASCAGPARVRAVATLENDRFAVTSGSATYRLGLDAECGSRVRVVFRPDTNGGQALGIWQIAYRAAMKLDASIGLQFWDRRVDFVWPATADYYSFGTVHISRGDHWDIVGHELGHAVYDLADVGSFGGGQHKIDECYSNALALSEGWASYFSGWVSVGLDDPDARFEYMVPRRAPIRFENVPEDVCKGPTNEWRVTSFFWDLIDLNADGESAEEAFARVWRALARSGSRSVTDAAAKLERAGIAKDLVDLAWALNFGAPR